MTSLSIEVGAGALAARASAKSSSIVSMREACAVNAGAALRALVGGWALAACALETPPPMPLPVGDEAVFAAAAQPALDRRCAEPSCHADAARPLAIYSAGRRRADPARLHLIEPLTAEELQKSTRAGVLADTHQLANGAESGGARMDKGRSGGAGSSLDRR